MSNRSINLDEALYDYLLRVSLRETPLLKALREETAADPMKRMQIAPEQGQFMAILAKLIGARRYLEVGVFTGYSSLAVGMALPPDGEIVACDVSEEWTDIAKRYWEQAGIGDRVHVMEFARRILRGRSAGWLDSRYASPGPPVQRLAFPYEG